MTTYRGIAPYDVGPVGSAISAADFGASSTNGSGTVKWQTEGRRFFANPAGYPNDLCAEYEGQRTVWTDRAYGADMYWAGWVKQPEHPSSELIISEFRNVGGTVQSAWSFGTAGGIKLLGSGGSSVDTMAGDQADDSWWWVVHRHQTSGTATLLVYNESLVLKDTLTGAAGTSAVTRHREGRAAAITGKTKIDEGQVTDTLPTTTSLPSMISNWVGDVTHTSFRMTTLTRGVSLIRVKAIVNGATVVTTSDASPDAQGYAKHLITGLTPKTDHNYKVEGWDGSSYVLIGQNDA